MRSGLQLQRLEAEAERLSDLLSVMEDREEQLLGQVRREEEARRSAEDRVRTSEVALAGRRAAEEVGDKMKKVLMLIMMMMIMMIMIMMIMMIMIMMIMIMMIMIIITNCRKSFHIPAATPLQKVTFSYLLTISRRVRLD